MPQNDMPDYDPTTALLVVDVQNDFADPNGSLSVAGGMQVVPYLNDQIERAKKAGALVAYTQDWHPAHTPHFAIDGGPWPVHCVMNSWGAQLYPTLDVVGEVVHKGQGKEDGYSGFTMRDSVSGALTPTALHGLLRSHGIVRVIIGGLATDYCVLETARDAVKFGYVTSVLREGIRAVDVTPGDGDRAIEEMTGFGVTMVA